MPDESRDEDVVVLEVILFQNDHDFVARFGFAILDEPRMTEPLGPLCPDDLVRIRCGDADSVPDDSVERDLLYQELSTFRIDTRERSRQKLRDLAVDVRVEAVDDRLSRRQRHSDGIHRYTSFLVVGVVWLPAEAPCGSEGSKE